MLIPICTVSFPEITLESDMAEKLRGFMGYTFRQHSDLLHNHLDDTQFIYRYPPVQYKVINNIPVIIGINEGAELLAKLVGEIHFINIDGKTYPVRAKAIDEKNYKIGVINELYEYRFLTPWFGLNQENYKIYGTAKPKDKIAQLEKILIGNILSFFKSQNYFVKNTINMKLSVKIKTAEFKGQKIIVFNGKFITNALLPDYIGLGKSVSRGLGTIIKTKIL